MRDRNERLNMRVNEDEREMLRALSVDEDMPASMLVRKWIRQKFEARFGEVRRTPAKKSA